jgi:hypothetical protein
MLFVEIEQWTAIENSLRSAPAADKRAYRLSELT